MVRKHENLAARLALTLLTMASACSANDNKDSGKAAGDSGKGKGAETGSGSAASGSGKDSDFDIVQSAPFLLVALDCDVVNANDAAATQTTFGCSLKDEHGVVVTDPVEPIGAKVAEKASTNTVAAKISAQLAGGAFQFAFIADGISPSAASSLTFTAIYKGKKEEWIFLVPPSYLTKTIANLDLYVDAVTGDDQGLCQKTAACKTVGRAVSLVPEVLSHAVTIRVAATAPYAEDVIVQNKTVTSGRFAIQGTAADFQTPAKPTIVGKSRTMTLANVNAPNGRVVLESLILSLPHAAGDAAHEVYDSALRVEAATATAFNVDIVGGDSIIDALHDPDVGIIAPYEVADKSGHGIELAPGSALTVKDVSIVRFVHGVSIRVGTLAVIGPVTIQSCLRGVFGDDNSAVTVRDDPVQTTKFKIVVKDVVNAFYLSNSSSFFQNGAQFDGLDMTAIPPPASVDTAGIRLYNDSTFGNVVNGDLKISGFGFGAVTGGSSTFFWHSSLAKVGIDGCTNACIYASSSKIDISTSNIEIAAAAPIGMLLVADRQSGVYFRYYDAMKVRMPANGWTGAASEQRNAELTDQSFVQIWASEAKAPAELPTLGFLGLTSGSELLIVEPAGSRGVVAAAGATCFASGWNFDASADTTDDCIHVK